MELEFDPFDTATSQAQHNASHSLLKLAQVPVCRFSADLGCLRAKGTLYRLAQKACQWTSSQQSNALILYGLESGQGHRR